MFELNDAYVDDFIKMMEEIFINKEIEEEMDYNE